MPVDATHGGLRDDVVQRAAIHRAEEAEDEVPGPMVGGEVPNRREGAVDREQEDVPLAFVEGMDVGVGVGNVDVGVGVP